MKGHKFPVHPERESKIRHILAWDISIERRFATWDLVSGKFGKTSGASFVPSQFGFLIIKIISNFEHSGRIEKSRFVTN